MLELFDTAFACRKRRGATTTRRQIEQQRDRYLAKAGELRDDADHRCCVRRSIQCQERYRKLEDAAQAYEDYASEVYATSSGDGA